jgi:lysophospholipase L1-like esterase
LRRIVRTLGATVTAAGAFVALQTQIARRRDYLRLAPDDELFESAGARERDLHLVVIGDSTAVGVGAGSRRKSYPALLAERLGREVPVRLTVVGRPGLRWKHVPALVAEVTTIDPDIVLIGVGGNDAIHLTPLSDVRATVASVVDELQRARATVLVMLGPRFDSPAIPRPLRDLIAARCRAVNRAIVAAASAAGVRVVDTESVITDRFARDPIRLYSEDLFHPSAAGYEVWAGAIEPHLEAAALERSL